MGVCHRSSGKEVGYIPPLGQDKVKQMRENFNTKEIS